MATTIRQQAEVLQGMRLFKAVPPEHLAAFLKQVKLRRFGTGEVVFQSGAPADRAMLVVAGRLMSTVGEGASACTVGEVSTGEVVGETALFIRDGHRGATVVAMEPTRCLVITRELLQRSASNPAVVAIERHLLGSMARRIRSTNLTIQKIWKDDGGAGAVQQQPAATQRGAPPLTIRQRLRGLFGRDR